ncbi:RcpC/CpaB family pilus assembly protein [Streptomyces sp. TRM64462]|uniref:RcpC/CpaB family pilus assembly protein n=1 Tax=Streptomyces sp. TRM64462 TaxID=2741726 RepID=UPI0028162E09|nr:RcpC/CpaB family pilus assembly protein [Streptomyces sp. TRM64462]
MPQFAPLRVRGGRYRLRRAVRRRRRAVAAGLAMTAAALAASGFREPVEPAAQVAERRPGAEAPRTVAVTARPVELVSAPVRIADGETVRLLRPGDRVDVIAAPVATGMPPDGGPEARVVAAGVRVTDVPRPEGGHGHGEDADAGALAGAGGGGGALVVLAVPRATATDLAMAAATSSLAVTLC